MKVLMSLMILASGTAFSAGNDWKNLLPKQEIKGEIVVVGAADPEVKRIALKMQAAAQKDPAFFQEQVKKAGPGKPISYDKRLGVAEWEFKKFLSSGSDGGFALQKVSSATFIPSADGFSIKGPNANYSFRASISSSGSVASEFSKPYGEPTKFDNVKAPGGGMKGYSFKVEDAVNEDPQAIEGYTSNLVVGQFYDSKMCFVSVDSKQAKKGALVMKKDFIFRYRCP